MRNWEEIWKTLQERQAEELEISVNLMFSERNPAGLQMHPCK